MNENFHPPRWLARILAHIYGYFYLPCPRCGRMFAGWECGHGIIVTHTKRDVKGFMLMRKGFTCCWRCPSDATDSPTVKHEVVT